jgi:hypothetical protein
MLLYIFSIDLTEQKMLNIGQFQNSLTKIIEHYKSARYK